MQEQILKNVVNRHLEPQIQADSYYTLQNAARDMSAENLGVGIVLAIGIAGILLSKICKRPKLKKLEKS